jgi:hypothetical protein
VAESKAALSEVKKASTPVRVTPKDVVLKNFHGSNNVPFQE